MAKHKIQSARYELVWSNVQSDKIGEDGEFEIDIYKHRLPRNRNKDPGPTQSDSTTFKRVNSSFFINSKYRKKRKNIIFIYSYKEFMIIYNG